MNHVLRDVWSLWIDEEVIKSVNVYGALLLNYAPHITTFRVPKKWWVSYVVM